jgi:hypothetical protein
MTGLAHRTSRVSSAVLCDLGASSCLARFTASRPLSCIERRGVVVRTGGPPPGDPGGGIRQHSRRRSHGLVLGCGRDSGGVRGGGLARSLRYRLAVGPSDCLRLCSPRSCRRRGRAPTVVSVVAPPAAPVPRGRSAVLLTFHRAGHRPVAFSTLRAFARSASHVSSLPHRQPGGTVPATSMTADRCSLDPWFSVSGAGSDGTR